MMVSKNLWLVPYLAVWYCLLKSLDTLIRDSCTTEIQFLHLGQSQKMSQSGIANLRVLDIQHFEFGQPLEMPQSGVADSRVLEIELFQVGQPLEMF